MANLKNTVFSGTQFRLPAGNSADRPGSPEAREIRFNTESGKLEQYRPDVGDWLPSNNTGVIATGGDSVYDVDAEGTRYRVHIFTSIGTSSFDVQQSGEVEYFVVAGGGGGGRGDDFTGGGGGGGAGGLLHGILSPAQQSYSIVVGSGGSERSNGSDSSVFGVTSTGGGGGNGGSGGSGAGAFRQKGIGSGITGQGNGGGNSGNTSSLRGGGGAGGGAGSPGQNGNGDSGGNGGLGKSANLTGYSTFYAGGGGGGKDASGQYGFGGLGGGGDSHDDSTGLSAEDGVNGTGGGGGGSSSDVGGNSNAQPAGRGGDGIVIIRYPLRQDNSITAEGSVVNDGLVLDLDFAKPTVYNGSGSIVTDSRLNGIEGTVLGTTNIKNNRTQNSNFRFNGSGSNIDLGNPAAFDRQFEEITIEFITKRTGNGGVIYSCELVKNGSFYVRLDEPNRFQFRTWHTVSGGSGNETFGSFNYDQWYHMVVTWDGSFKRGYLNGSKIGPDFSQSGALVNSGSNLIIGARGSSPDRGIEGNIGLCRVYDKALTGSEIQQNFEVLRWRFGL